MGTFCEPCKHILAQKHRLHFRPVTPFFPEKWFRFLSPIWVSCFGSAVPDSSPVPGFFLCSCRLLGLIQQTQPTGPGGAGDRYPELFHPYPTPEPASDRPPKEGPRWNKKMRMPWPRAMRWKGGSWLRSISLHNTSWQQQWPHSSGFAFCSLFSGGVVRIFLFLFLEHRLGHTLLWAQRLYATSRKIVIRS